MKNGLLCKFRTLLPDIGIFPYAHKLYLGAFPPSVSRFMVFRERKTNVINNPGDSETNDFFFSRL